MTRLWLADLLIEDAEGNYSVYTQRVGIAEADWTEEEVYKRMEEYVKVYLAEPQYLTAIIVLYRIDTPTELITRLRGVDLRSITSPSNIPYETIPASLVMEVSYSDDCDHDQQIPSRLEKLVYPSRKAAEQAAAVVRQHVQDTYPEYHAWLFNCWIETLGNAADTAKNNQKAVNLCDHILQAVLSCANEEIDLEAEVRMHPKPD